MSIDIVEMLLSRLASKHLARRLLFLLPLFFIAVFLLWHFRHPLHGLSDQLDKAFASPSSDNSFFLSSLSLIFIVFVGALIIPLMLGYLRTDSEPPRKMTRTSTDVSDLVRRMSARSEHRSAGLTPEIRKTLIDDIKAAATSQMAAGFEADLKKQYGPAMDVLQRAEHLRFVADRMRARLEAETRALMRRGNLNLVLGTVTTAAAAIMLGYVALTAKMASDDWRHYLPVYLLRLSVAIFIEIFAFFFLRLYRNSLAEVKYFQNEITNLEAKCLAFEFGVLSSDKTVIDKVVEELARTERNSVIKKDETTVELERARLDSQHVQEILGAIKSFLPSRKE